MCVCDSIVHFLHRNKTGVQRKLTTKLKINLVLLNLEIITRLQLSDTPFKSHIRPIYFFIDNCQNDIHTNIYKQY